MRLPKIAPTHRFQKTDRVALTGEMLKNVHKMNRLATMNRNRNQQTQIHTNHLYKKKRNLTPTHKMPQPFYLAVEYTHFFCSEAILLLFVTSVSSQCGRAQFTRFVYSIEINQKKKRMKKRIKNIIPFLLNTIYNGFK